MHWRTDFCECAPSARNCDSESGLELNVSKTLSVDAVAVSGSAAYGQDDSGSVD